ncbi:MAG: hypothetical protein ACREXP_21510 [Steroidobacteraceae bacterium]
MNEYSKKMPQSKSIGALLAALAGGRADLRLAASRRVSVQAAGETLIIRA